MTHIVRILFLVVVMAITISYAYQAEIYRTGPNYVTLFILVPALTGAALVLVDMFWHRKRLHVLSGLFFGVLTGLFFAYILSLVVNLFVSLFSPPVPVAVPPEPKRPPVPAILARPEPERTAEMTDAQWQDRQARYAQAQAEYSLRSESYRQAKIDYEQAKAKQETFLAHVKTVQLIKMLLGASAVFLCVTIVMQTKDDFRFVIPYVQFSRQTKGARPILLDTSVIIDGRIADIAETRILESQVVVPRFILAELQAIADSGDKLKRNRGRRGLDVLNRLQSLEEVDIEILDPHVNEVVTAGDVDAKLVALAKHLDGRVVTNDYNLNKIAGLRGVEVININDLANALKPVVLPGEAMAVRVIKPGEESGQGVGYLDDGTMVVVEQGREFIGREVSITVTSVLQTSAGRMIFGRVDPDRTFSSRDKQTQSSKS
jgi:uncharacterized protein YacL